MIVNPIHVSKVFAVRTILLYIILSVPIYHLKFSLTNNIFLVSVTGKCASNPCQNGGSCFNTVKSDDRGFLCECPDGWTGDTCSDAIGILKN